MLSRELIRRGHAVRGTTRDLGRVAEITAAGAEAMVADPDRVATLVGAFDHVTVACVLLGSARGSAESLAALHSSRLEMLLTKIVDTTVRGVVYEAGGSVGAGLLEEGAARVEAFAKRSLAEWALLEADPADRVAWLAAAVDAVDSVLGR
jgi:putative NADH-flavin reductase